MATKKYNVVENTEASEEKQATDFYYYLKEAIVKNPYGSVHTKNLPPDWTDLNVLIEGWNKYIDRPDAWTWTTEKIKESEDTKSCQVKIWIGNPDGDKDNKGRILRDYKKAFVDEYNGHVIVKDNPGMLFLELLMATFGTEFFKNRLTLSREG